MSTAIQRRRGTAAEHASFTGLPGETTVNTTDWTDHVHDGVTPGGHRLAKKSELDAIGVADAVGTLIFVAAQSAPAGTLKANGAAISISAYAALATKIYCGDSLNATAAWGYKCTNSASPSTSRSTAGTYIVLPDMRGEFVRGWDDGRGIDASRSLWSSQAGMLESHTHAINIVSALSPVGGSFNYQTAPGSTSFAATVMGSYGGTETRPRNLAALICIKY